METSNPADADIGLWIAEYEASPNLEALVSLLSAEEHGRLSAILSARRRDEYVIARALVRSVLGRKLVLEPHEVQIVVEPEGRPGLGPGHPQEWSFSVSHTDGMVVLAVSRTGKVGVDVEARSGQRDARALARRFFHLLEQEHIVASADDRELQERFLHVWTLKEAYLKALGTGVRGSLASFGFGFEEANGKIRFLPNTELSQLSDKWDFEISHPTPEHVLALAYKEREAATRGPSVRRYRVDLPDLGGHSIEHRIHWSSQR